MTYIKRIRICPLRSNTGRLMWQLSFWMNYNDFWFECKQPLFYLTKSAYSHIEALLSGGHVKHIKE